MPTIWAILKSIAFEVKTDEVYVLATLGKIKATFNSNIWVTLDCQFAILDTT